MQKISKCNTDTTDHFKSCHDQLFQLGCYVTIKNNQESMHKFCIPAYPQGIGAEGQHRSWCDPMLFPLLVRHPLCPIHHYLQQPSPYKNINSSQHCKMKPLKPKTLTSITLPSSRTTRSLLCSSSSEGTTPTSEMNLPRKTSVPKINQPRIHTEIRNYTIRENRACEL